MIEVWADQTCKLGKKFRWVQVFENKGVVMGCSNPHPHGQIWASNHIPHIPGVEDERQLEYSREHSNISLLDYMRREKEAQERIVVDSEYCLAVVPYWASWPYEILLLPKRHVLRLPDLTDVERIDLPAERLRAVGAPAISVRDGCAPGPACFDGTAARGYLTFDPNNPVNGQTSWKYVAG